MTFEDVEVDDNTVCADSYTIERTWTATDACGNATSCLQIIKVDDTTAPVCASPQDVTIDCTASTDPTAIGNPIATDNCDSDLTYEPTPDVIVQGACDANYTITRKWFITDNCDNFTTCDQVITVKDTDAPDIICPDNVTIECTDDSAAGPGTLTGEAVATDNCSEITLDHDDFTETSVLCPENKRIHRIWMQLTPVEIALKVVP